MKINHLLLTLGLLTNSLFASEAPSISANEALKKLLDGNERYSKAQDSSSKPVRMRRLEVAQKQHPFAVIVACSDSRVSPEIVFDQNLGDLFVIRVAGNVVDDLALGSIEYAVEHLGVRLILVQGHERCGAVAAAVQGGETHGHVKKLVEEITPAVEKVKGAKGDLMENAVKQNALSVGKKIRESTPILSKFASEGKLMVVEAFYDLDTGLVSLVPESSISK
jgi:carbonic anhydrase